MIKAGAAGLPELPLFTIGPISDAGKAALRKYLPETAFTGSPFLPEQTTLGGLPPINSP